MPRYYFHLHNDMEVPDEEGSELADLEAARTLAVASAREMAAEAVREGVLNLDHSIDVTSDDGCVLTVRFRDVVEIVGAPRSSAKKQ